MLIIKVIGEKAIAFLLSLLSNFKGNHLLLKKLSYPIAISLLLILCFYTNSQLRKEKEKNLLLLNAKEEIKNESEQVFISGPTEEKIVEKIVYKEGPVKFIEKIKYIKSDSISAASRSKTLQTVPLAKQELDWLLGYHFLGATDPSHALLLGHRVGRLFLSAGPLYQPSSRRFGYGLGLALRF